jgi:hypothetical protein
MSDTIIPEPSSETKGSVPPPPIQSADDHEHLHRFEQMRDLLRDRTRAVAEHYQNGCYVVGRPGSSKTFTILVETGIELGTRAGGESGTTSFQRLAPRGATSNTFSLDCHIIA